MNAKTARDAIHEFLSLFCGSDTAAEQLLVSFFPKPAEHRVLPSDLLSSVVKEVSSKCQLAQPELDEEWRLSFLQALLTLAAAGKPYVPLMRRGRAQCDYVLFEANTTVRDANTKVFKDTFNEIVAVADGLVSDNRSAQGSSSSKRNLLNEYIKENRLSDWMQRAVIADLISKQWEHTLSDIGRMHLTRFRESFIGRSIPERFARPVFTTLDHRGIWSEMSNAGLTMSEVNNAAFDVSCSLSSIENGKWEGDFSYYAQTGVFEPDYGAIEEYMHTEPEFEEFGHYAWVAQRHYKHGASIAESIAYVKGQMKMDSRVSTREGNVRSELTLQKDNSKQSTRNGSPLSPPDFASSATEEPSSSDSDPNLKESEEEIDRIRENVSRCEILKEICADFGEYSLEKFLSIHYGLTGAIDANFDTVFNTLQTALSFKRSKQHPKHVGWVESIADTDVLVIALSYKHQRESVRLDPKTVEKIATAVCQIAENEGMSKVNIWLDAILSQNRDIADSSWAVNGLYPYLCCDVFRVIGSDHEYSDGSEKSMWMQVEMNCADKEHMITLRLDETRRGFNFTTDDHVAFGRKTVRTRMMELSKSICQGELIGKLTSWREDKRNLIFWAECCMQQNAPVLMDDHALRRTRVLRIDNMNPSEIKRYLEKASSTGFIQGGDTTGIREGVRGWTGVFELLPGLREASERDWIPLVPCADEGFKLFCEYPQGGEMVLLGFGTFVVIVDMDSEGAIRWVTHDNLTDDERLSFEDYKYLMRQSCKGEPRPLEDDAERRWGQEAS